MTTVNGIHCCRRWLKVTVVTMENMFLFRKQQSSKSVEGMYMHVKYTANSSSLLTRLGLVQASSSRTFTASITLAMARHCSCASFFNGRASSQFTVHSYARYTTHERSEKRRSSKGLCRFSQFCNVAASTWLRLWLDSRMSTYLALGNTTVVFENSCDSTIPLSCRSICHTNTRQTVKYTCLVNSYDSTIPLSCLSICHNNTCQDVKYTRLVNLWYSPDSIMFARLSVCCRYTWAERA